VLYNWKSVNSHNRQKWLIFLHQRVFVFSLSLATSFAILILFINYLEGIIVSIFFLTAAVVAASRADLKELSSAKWTFVVLISLIAALIVGVSLSLTQFSTTIFIPLAILNSGLLIAYFLMKRAAKTEIGEQESTKY
jgi:hypothetical protein